MRFKAGEVARVSALKDEILAGRVIAAVRDDEGLRRACLSRAGVIFLLGGELLELEKRVAQVRGHGKRVLLHIDLCDGLGRDAAAVDYCARIIRPDGIISTRAPLIKRAAEHGLCTVQRLFLMDSQSLVNGVRLLRGSDCDMVEVLPGLAPKAISFMRCELDRPLIAGGMITTAAEVRQAFAAGAAAVSTSCAELWDDISLKG